MSVRQLILPELVEIGYINPERVEAMAETFIEQGMVKDKSNLEGFIYEPQERFSLWGNRSFLLVLAVALVSLVVLALLVRFNRRLQREIYERKEAELLLKVLADTDSLTQLFNRRAFSQRYNSELIRAQRYGDVFSIILIDLDYFKRVNDTLGHGAGDQVLMEMAKVIRELTRETDICGRFGGEEFIILQPRTAMADAEVFAGRLCEEIHNRQVDLSGGESVTISASIGVAQWQNQDQGEATIIRADKALYKAKDSGRDRVVCWSEQLQ